MKILVTLDGSPFSESVLPAAASLAQAAAGSEVRLVMVISSTEPEIWSDVPDYPMETRARVDPTGGLLPLPMPGARAVEDPSQAAQRRRVTAMEYLEGISRRYFGGRARVTVLEGDHPAKEVLRLVEVERPQVIAMATHGRTGLATIVMGNMTQAMMKSAGVPLLLVRPSGLRSAA